MRRITINPEIGAMLAAGRQAIVRQEQRFAYQDALGLAVEVGRAMCPGFVLDKDNSFAYGQFAKWLVADETMRAETPERKVRAGVLTKGIYLQGAVGSGKSMCMDIFRIVAKYLDIRLGEEPLAWSSPRCDKICEDFRTSGDYGAYTRARVLCLQDLGAEQGETIYMGNRINVLRQLLEYRGDNPNCLTLVTTNIPIDKIGDYYGPRVQSRLVQMCNVLTIGGGDRRR